MQTYTAFNTCGCLRMCFVKCLFWFCRCCCWHCCYYCFILFLSLSKECFFSFCMSLFTSNKFALETLENDVMRKQLLKNMSPIHFFSSSGNRMSYRRRCWYCCCCSCSCHFTECVTENDCFEQSHFHTFKKNSLKGVSERTSEGKCNK